MAGWVAACAVCCCGWCSAACYPADGAQAGCCDASGTCARRGAVMSTLGGSGVAWTGEEVICVVIACVGETGGCGGRVGDDGGVLCCS